MFVLEDRHPGETTRIYKRYYGLVNGVSVCEELQPDG